MQCLIPIHQYQSEKELIIFSLLSLVYKNVETKTAKKKSILNDGLEYFLYLINIYSCIINTQYKLMASLPNKIAINFQFNSLLTKICSQLSIDPIKQGKFTEDTYLKQVKTILTQVPVKISAYKQLEKTCKGILFDCQIINRKDIGLQQTMNLLHVIKARSIDGFNTSNRLQSFKVSLSKIEQFSKANFMNFENFLKREKLLLQSDVQLLIKTAKLGQELYELKSKNLQRENEALLNGNKLIGDIFKNINARGILSEDIEQASLLSDIGLSYSLKSFLECLQNYFVSILHDNPFLKIIHLLSFENPVFDDIQTYMNKLPKIQKGLLNPLVQKAMRSQHIKPTGQSFESKKISQNKVQLLQQRNQELQTELQLKQIQKTQVMNKQEQLQLEFAEEKKKILKKLKDEESKNKSIQQKYTKAMQKMKQEYQDYKNKMGNIEEENTKTNIYIQRKNEKAQPNNKDSERDILRLNQEIRKLKQQITQAEGRFLQERQEKQQQIDRLQREKNELKNMIQRAESSSNNDQINPMLSKYQQQSTLFSFELQRERENHTKLQEFITKLQNQLRNNENETIKRLRANEKIARKSYSDLQILHQAQQKEKQKLYAQINQAKEAARQAQSLKTEMNTLKVQYNLMRENYMKLCAGEGEVPAPTSPRRLVRETSKK